MATARTFLSIVFEELAVIHIIRRLRTPTKERAMRAAMNAALVQGHVRFVTRDDCALKMPATPPGQRNKKGGWLTRSWQA